MVARRLTGGLCSIQTGHQDYGSVIEGNEMFFEAFAVRTLRGRLCDRANACVSAPPAPAAIAAAT